MAETAAITKEGVMAVIAAATEDQDCMKMEYSSSSKLQTGLCTDVELPGGFKFTVDEPVAMPGGANQGPNPLDVLCGSFGTCEEIGFSRLDAEITIDAEATDEQLAALKGAVDA